MTHNTIQLQFDKNLENIIIFCARIYFSFNPNCHPNPCPIMREKGRFNQNLILKSYIYFILSQIFKNI
jgi:hypothetical protein